MSYDNSKQVILRKIQVDNPKPTTPVMSVEFTGPDGVKYEAPLWPWTRKDGSAVLDKNGNAMYQGSYKEDTYKQQQGDQGIANAKAAAQPSAANNYTGDFDDSDIPF